MNRFFTAIAFVTLIVILTPIKSYATLDRFNCDTIVEPINIKSNLLTDAVGTLSLGTEVKLSGKLSLDLSGTWNPFTFTDGVKYKHWMVRPELRYWFARPMHHHFMGLHILGGQFNMQRGTFPFNAYPSLRDYRYQGWTIGAGLSYGYRWNFTSRLAMEGVVGIGYMFADYDKYKCGNCGERVGEGRRNSITATHVALNLIYRFGKTDKSKIKTDIDTNQIISSYMKSSDFAANAPDTITIFKTDTIYPTPQVKRDSFALRLHYPLDQSVIVADIADNAMQLDSLRSFVARYASDPTVKISGIRLLGYASPEATVTHNKELSARRAAAVADLILDYMPELAGYIQSEGMGEDWQNLDFEGYTELMEIKDADVREKMLRELNNGEIFRYLLDEVFPSLRRTECEIEFTKLTY